MLLASIVGIEAECNKNKHCEAGSFCACERGVGDVGGLDGNCAAGQPSFEPGTVACERYERGCGLTATGATTATGRRRPCGSTAGQPAKSVWRESPTTSALAQCVPAMPVPTEYGAGERGRPRFENEGVPEAAEE